MDKLPITHTPNEQNPLLHIKHVYQRYLISYIFSKTLFDGHEVYGFYSKLLGISYRMLVNIILLILEFIGTIVNFVLLVVIRTMKYFN